MVCMEDIKNGAVDPPIVKCVHIILPAHDNNGAGKSAPRNFRSAAVCVPIHNCASRSWVHETKKVD